MMVQRYTVLTTSQSYLICLFKGYKSLGNLHLQPEDVDL